MLPYTDRFTVQHDHLHLLTLHYICSLVRTQHSPESAALAQRMRQSGDANAGISYDPADLRRVKVTRTIRASASDSRALHRNTRACVLRVVARAIITRRGFLALSQQHTRTPMDALFYSLIHVLSSCRCGIAPGARALHLPSMRSDGGPPHLRVSYTRRCSLRCVQDEEDDGHSP